MKKTIVILSLSAVAAASVQTASAGDREWATVGKVLTGVAAIHVLAHAFHPPPVYVGEVAYAAPVPLVPVAPAYVRPAPVVVYPRPVVIAPPVYVAPRFCAPPVLSVNVGLGHHHHHHRGHWHGW